MTERALVAIVEDDEVLGRSLRQRFLLEGFRVSWFTTIEEARRALSGRAVDLVLSDIRLPDGDAGQLMAEIFDAYGVLPTIFMTAFADIEQAVRLIKRGARDYVEKPFDLDGLVEKVRSILTNFSADEEEPFTSFGLSSATLNVRKTLDKVADLDVPVLIQGETGTGKDVAARYLHAAGNRNTKPFIAFNCSSVPESLFDDTLFGHEKGAFSGATSRQRGLVEQAGDGTLFLDEVAEIPLTLQVKLLRLIEAREYRRLGGAEALTTSARFVFASNQDLGEAVQRGTFREDLWFRMNVVTVEMPSLRSRREEIGPLMYHYIAGAARRMGRHVPTVDPEVLTLADVDHWRGNVRELVNRAERALALCEDGRITIRDFWPDRVAYSAATVAPSDEQMTLSQIREQAESRHIAFVLHQCGGRVQDAAKQLGISRTTLWGKMGRYGLTSTEEKS